MCYWICNGQMRHAYTSDVIARATQAVRFIVYGRMVNRLVFILSVRTSRCIFFFFFFWERHYFTLCRLSSLCIPPPSKPAKNTGNSLNCLYMRLCKPYSKTAGFLGFSTFHVCACRPIQNLIFLCMGLVFPFSEFGLWIRTF